MRYAFDLDKQKDHTVFIIVDTYTHNEIHLIVSEDDILDMQAAINNYRKSE